MKKIILLSIISSGYLMPSSIINKVVDTSGQTVPTHAIKNLRGSVIEKKAMSYIDYLTTGKGQDFNFADPKLEGFTPEDVKLLQQFVDEFFIKKIVNIEGKNQLADQNYLELAVPLPAWLADRYENITDKILSDRFIQEFDFLGPQNIRRGIIEYIYQNNSQHNKGHCVFFYGKKNADYAADIVKIQRAIATMVNHFSTYVRFMGNILDVSFDEDTNDLVPLDKYVPVDEDVKYIIVPAQNILRLLDIMKKYQEDRQNITFIIAFDDNHVRIPDYFGGYRFNQPHPLNFIKNIVVAGISLKSIEHYFFDGCTGLKSIIVPQGVTQVGNYFLSKCTGLIQVQLPQGLTRVGHYFLFGCSSLTQVQLPQALTRVGHYFLAGCSSLTQVQLPQWLTQIGSYFLSNCNGLTELQLPQGLTQIGDYFLVNCRSLTQLQLPQGLTRVGDDFLRNCGRLIKLQLPQGLTQVGNYFLEHCSGLTRLQLPQGLTQVGDYFLGHCSGLPRLQLPQGLTQVGNYFLAYCGRLTQLELPQGLTQVGNHFLSKCIGLSQLELPKRLIQVGNDFLKGTYLEKLSATDSVLGIPSVKKFIMENEDVVISGQVEKNL